jgi:lysophospholipase L1-like esterase
MIRWLLATALLCRISFGAATNEILLHASTAAVHGEMLRYEPETNKICLGYWTKPTDWAEWSFKVEAPAVYEIEVWQGCGKGNGGSDVRIEVAGQALDFVVHDTGHFQNFIPRHLGRIHFSRAGEFKLAIKPQNKKAAAVMDIRQIKLTKVPTEAETSVESQMLNARRIVFLGDSITHGGEYIEFLEAYLRLTNPHAEFDIINLGLPSETVSGLSEPGHAGGQFPRPDLHERLDRVLEKTKPDLIFACYGMNDGIYYPLGEERFAKFREGMLKLRAKAKAAGARVIHLTPPVFDSAPIKANTLPAGREEYRQPYEGYDDVLDAYSQWLIAQHADGWEVIDIHGTMKAALVERRQREPNFRFAGDGVHAGTEGNWLMTETILGVFKDGSKIWEELSPRGPELLKLVRQQQRLRKEAWLNEVGHKRPGMGKGKPVAEAEAEASQIALKIAALQDPQLPGKRTLWNGFESAEFAIDGKLVRVVAPKKALLLSPWIAVARLDEQARENAKLAEAGFHLVEASAPVGEVLSVTYGLADEALGRGLLESMKAKGLPAPSSK